MGFRHSLFGWERSNFTHYQAAYYKYGGSVNTHPDIINFFMQKKEKEFAFWHYRRDGEVTAAYFTSDENTFGLNVWRDYPVSYDEIIIPMAADQKIVLPVKTNRLSSSLRGNIINATYVFREKRKVCLIKTSFSGKTVKKRNGELRKMLAAGGECIPLREMSPADIADIYVHLFRLRFADSVRCYNRKNITVLLTALPHMVTGNVLFFEGAPVAIDLVLCARSEKSLYFDVPNGGIDPSITAFSPGSLLMWKNIVDAREVCRNENKAMQFSIGLYDKKWDYKLLWAETQPTGKSLVL